MYEAHNHKELKKLLEEGKTPILVRDRNTIEVVKTMESLKSKGVLGSIKEKIIGTLVGGATTNMITESTVVILGIITAATLIALYAIYRKKNIKIKYNPDGSVTLETSN